MIIRIDLTNLHFDKIQIHTLYNQTVHVCQYAITIKQ